MSTYRIEWGIAENTVFIEHVVVVVIFLSKNEISERVKQALFLSRIRLHSFPGSRIRIRKPVLPLAILLVRHILLCFPQLHDCFSPRLPRLKFLTFIRAVHLQVILRLHQHVILLQTKPIAILVEKESLPPAPFPFSFPGIWDEPGGKPPSCVAQLSH